MKIKLSALKPNPFRMMDHYPLDPERMDTLKRSIEETSFWDNVVVRENGSGEFQISYGHHRLAAAKEVLGESYEADLPCRSLSDEHMLKMMIAENESIHSHRADVLKENVLAVKEWFETTEGKDEYERLKAAHPDGQNQKVLVYCKFMSISRDRAEIAFLLIKADNPEVEKFAPSVKHAQAIIRTVKDKEIAVELAEASREIEMGRRAAEGVGRAIKSVVGAGAAEEKKQRQRQVLKAALDSPKKPVDAAETAAAKILQRARTPEEEREHQISTAEELLGTYCTHLSRISVGVKKMTPVWEDIDVSSRGLFLKRATSFIRDCRRLDEALKNGGKEWPALEATISPTPK